MDLEWSKWCDVEKSMFKAGDGTEARYEYAMDLSVGKKEL